jgi:hypothetical protein
MIICTESMSGQTNVIIWIKRHSSGLTLVAGSLLISAWTLLRFFDQAHHFDLYGQEALARQWLQGVHIGSAAGPTNYAWKMLLLYVPLDSLPGSPRLKLIVLTLLINIVMFVTLTILIQALWRQLVPKSDKPDWRLQAAMLWFASMAGSIFWIQYANSRNLEVAGGMLLIWLGLRYVQRISWLRWLGLLALSGLLFFADPLQLYMTALPLLVFVTGRQLLASRSLARFLPIVSLIVIVVTGLVLSKLLLAIVRHIWHLQILVGYGGLKPSLAPAALVHGSLDAIKQMAHLYTGGAGPHISRIREAVNLLIVGATVAAAVVAAIRKRQYRLLFGLAACIWIVDILVYVASGQATQADTGRYLIMTVPALMLVVPMALSLLKRHVQVLVIGAVLAGNCLTLGVALARSWQPSFPLDSHLTVVENYIQRHGYQFAYASMDTAIPANYLHDTSTTLLPLSCLPTGQVLPSYLFFDRGAFLQLSAAHQATIPFVLDGGAITNTPAVCTAASIEQQLGSPLERDQLSDGSSVLIYDTRTMQKLLAPRPGVANPQ